MDFKLPFRFVKAEDKIDLATANKILEHIEGTLQNRMPRVVTYTVSMNNDIGASYNEIVFCSTDNTFYGCTSPNVAGSATWVALH